MHYSKSFLIIVISLLISSYSFAQNFSVGFELGAGSSYIVEQYSSDGQINYSPSFTSKAYLNYSPLDSYFGLQLQFIQVSTTFDGRYGSGSYYDGEASSFTSSLILSHLNNDKTWNFGYDFGLGYTVENYQNSYSKNSNTNVRRFSSITLAGMVSFKANDRINIKLTPTALWTDPINSFRKDNWVNGREDFSLLVFLGLEYRLK